MVRKNYKWNISEKEGEKIVNQKINEALSKYGEMEIADLYFFIQTRSGDITILNNKKKKNLNNFIQSVFGGLRNFLDDRVKYKVTIKGNQVMIDLENNNSEKEDEQEDIYFLNDWIIVN